MGSYTCSCRDGFQAAVANEDDEECRDINECLEDSNLCESDADCVNTEGGYTCQCGAGFILNIVTEECEDVDECLEQDEVCGEKAVCSNTEGSFSCLCKSGYTSTVSGTCGDVDECLADPGLCGENGLCVNTDGSYQCLCEEGFARDDLTNSCKDTNECLDDGGDVCGDNSECVNTAGSYTCQCRQGYEGDPALGCADVDECSLSPQVCGDMAVCTNTDGSFHCACREGFEGNPPAVPCYPEAGDCDDGGAGCTPSLVRTKCKVNNDCPTDSSCKVGECRCRGGYSEEGLLCVDKNECELFPDICKKNSVCRNQVGGYMCVCEEGFARYPPSYTCSPVNKCKRECGDKAECMEGEEGIYICACDEGFVELLGGGCVEE